MHSAVIVDVVRTPLGRRNGSLKDWHPVDLAAHTLEALVARTGVDSALVEDVIMGCVMQVGDQAGNVGRNAALAAGFPESVVGTSVDRQCGSSQQAAHFAAQGVMAGAYDVVIAAGVETMTRVPMGSSFLPGSMPFGPKVFERYDLVPQGLSAEMIAEKWGIDRETNDAFSVESHLRAARATDEGRFETEIVPVPITTDDGERLFARDEGIRPDSSAEKLAQLKPAFKPDGGVITAGNSSQITDGAAAALIMSEEKADALGLRPRARFHAFALAGVDPVMMLTGPIPATTKVLERAEMTLDDIDLVEINEAFAPVVLAWEQEHHPDMSKVNVNGG
ncbi:MAG TPA: thiolase family protein, partial [Actinomycetes bacterium]|nr:thiolase family protein [Actinomycetes bacterium]